MNGYAKYSGIGGGSGGGGGVTSLNTQTGALTLVAGSNVVITPGSGTLTIDATGSGLGTVTSVGLVDSTGLFTVTGSPVTTMGSLTLSAFASQTAKTFLAAPNGSSGAPSFRLIVASDIPTLNQNTTGTATNITASSNSSLTTLSSLSLPLSQTTGVATIAQGGTNNGALAVNAGGVLSTDGTKVTNVGAGSSGYFLKSNGASSPTWSPSSFTPVAPTIQTFSSGTAQTYTTPTSPAPLYLKVTLVGSGGGGGGFSGGSSPGGNGSDTTFGTSLLLAGGGFGGSGNGAGGSGGTNTISGGTALFNVMGASGGSGTAAATASGGSGGSSVLGGAGVGGFGNNPGNNAAANSGSGGGGGSTTNANSCSGGGAGGYLQVIINSPNSSYLYTIGAGGVGTNGGGNGADGFIVVEEYYQ